MRARVKPGQRRLPIAVATVSAVSLATVLTSLLIGPEPGGSVVSLAVGLFPALLTAFALVIALTVNVDSRWPALDDVIRTTLLRWWFLLSIGGVAVASYADQQGRTKWTTIAINIALLAGILGSASLYRLLRISSGNGRRAFLAGLLARAVERAEPGPIAHGCLTADASNHPAFAAFLSAVEVAGDTGNLAAFRDRIDELEEAGELVASSSIHTLLALDLRMLLYLAQATLLRRVESPEVGTTLVPRLAGLITEHSGKLLGLKSPPAARMDPQFEAALYLGQAARLLAWMAGAALAEAQPLSEPPLALRALAAGAVSGRHLLVNAADPDPPEHFLPEEHPWRHGVKDPLAALVLWWCICDLNGAHDGRAAYAVYEILTGEKFYGSFGFGDRYITSELRKKVCGDTAADAHGKRLEASRQAFERFGGFDTVLVELLAVNLACWRDRRAAIPYGFDQNWTVWEDPRRMARRARLLLPKPGQPAVASAQDAVTMLARLLSGGRAAHSLGGFVGASLDALPVRPFPPIWPTAQRPAASLLAVALHLAPRLPGGSTHELHKFLRAVPPALVDGALSLADRTLYIADPSASTSIEDPVLRLAQLVQFLHHDVQPADR